MKLLISTSTSKHVDKFRAEKMFNLIESVMNNPRIEIEGSPFVECAKYVIGKQNLDLYFVLLGEDVSPLTPQRCVVIDEEENIVFDPDSDNRTHRARYLTEPLYYKADRRERRLSKEIPFYLVSRRRAGELVTE